MLNRFQVVPAAYVLLLRPSPGTSDGAEQVLLQLRRGTGYMDGYWASAAAGHVEAGESVVAAALREVSEELGIALEPAAVVPLCAMHRTAGNGRAIDERVDFFFTCRSWTGTPSLQEADKAADLRWFALDALPEPVVPHEKFVLERLLAGGVAPVVAYGFG